MKRLSVNERNMHIKSIMEALKGLSYHQSLELLCETISAFVTAHNKLTADTDAHMPTVSDEPITDVASAFRYLREIRKVPKKVLTPDPYASVWTYLETIDTYTSITELRKQLVEQFGESATPSAEELYWHIQTNTVGTENRLQSPIFLFNNRYLIRRRGHLSRLENDPELLEFLSNLDRYYTGPELMVMIEKRFGKGRTPSKSALNRYLHKVAKVTDSANGEEKHGNK